MIDVVMLSRYGRGQASARHRFYQFIDGLQAEGFRCSIAPLFDDRLSSLRFANPTRFAAASFAAIWRRVGDLRSLSNRGVMMIQLEALPYVPHLLEGRVLPAHVPYVLDFDDAWFHRYDMHRSAVVRRLLGGKIPKLMERATAIIAGSAYIEHFARKFNDRVHVIPTTIDLGRYPGAPQSSVVPSDRPFTVGWIGSPSTTPFLQVSEQALGEFCRRRRAHVVLIGASAAPLRLPSVERMPWSEASEVKQLHAIDVGIMPLVDSPFARGKCAFKLIQYMGCWKPVIASPVGENVRVVENGVTGLLAADGDAWLSALETLERDTALRERMGRAGRAVVEARYSLAGALPRLAAVLRSASVEHDS